MSLLKSKDTMFREKAYYAHMLGMSHEEAAVYCGCSSNKIAEAWNQMNLVSRYGLNSEKRSLIRRDPVLAYKIFIASRDEVGLNLTRVHLIRNDADVSYTIFCEHKDEVGLNMLETNILRRNPDIISAEPKTCLEGSL